MVCVSGSFQSIPKNTAADLIQTQQKCIPYQKYAPCNTQGMEVKLGVSQQEYFRHFAVMYPKSSETISSTVVVCAGILLSIDVCISILKVMKFQTQKISH